MTEQMDKQEPATPFKLEEARKKGQIARSAELVGFTMLSTLLAGLLGVLPNLGAALARHTQWWLANAAFLAREPAALRHHGARIFDHLVIDYLVPVACAGIVATVVVSIVHAGVAWSGFPLLPDPARLSPASGLKRVFSRRNLVETLKLIAKLGLFVAAFVAAWSTLAQGLAATLETSPATTARHWFAATLLLTQALLTVFAAFAAFDLWFSKREFAHQMRMSRRDLKDEHKRREGDPEIRSKRRRTQLELLRRLGGLARVKDSDVVVTNPTHVAVALRYRPGETALPVTVALGRGLIARAVVALARRHRIPVVRKPALARALLRHGSPGAAISAEYQYPVAALYRWVISLPGSKVLT